MNAQSFLSLVERRCRQVLVLAVFAVAPLLTWAAVNPFAENVRTTPWQKPEEEQKSFRLPPGFETQLVAAEPDIFKPMNMAFDAQGRLWVTVTQEYPYPAPTNRVGRDAIKILEDTNGDGRADKITTFADGLNIPIGLYPFYSDTTVQRSNASTNHPTWKCIAWSIPNIWLLEDTNGDGVADKREVLYGPFDHARDTHGNQASFRRGFDGWLYATHGYNNDSHVKGRDGNEVHFNSGNTYRMRLDGSRVEHYTHGQVNPFGLAFDSLGNLFSSDCHSAPIYQMLAGAYYPSFGKPHDGLGFAPTMIEKQRGSTALDGISYYADELWPEEYRENIFVGDVMSSVILRDQAVERGATKIAQPKPDFLTTTDPWFRPVDTQLGPDGALYIADFYNRIIGHYEVPLAHPGRDRTSGRIWRIVYRAGGENSTAKLWPRFDFANASTEELVGELAHPNLTRRRLAMDQLTDRIGQSAVPLLRRTLASQSINSLQTVHCLWTLQRLGALEDNTLAVAAQHADRLVRVHAMRLLADKPAFSPAFRDLALKGLQDADALVQRCAAEALANHPDYESIQPLLAFRRRVPSEDTHLLYIARKSLRDQLDVEENFQRFAATQLNEADAKAVADAALGVRTATAGAFLVGYVQRAEAERVTAAEFLRHAARYAPTSSFDGLAQVARAKFTDDVDLQLTLLRSIQQGIEQRGSSLSDGLRTWAVSLAVQLLAPNEATPTWLNTPLEGIANQANPWLLQARRSADGDRDSLFLCSLPPGGESLTGILRSPPFTIPATLTFWMAGHDGPPDKPAQRKNFIRLRTVAGATLAETFSPRNDSAQRFTWDLSTHAGKQGVIEISDSDTGSAYAWLAVGRFEPNVAPLPKLSPSAAAQRQQAAADLAIKLRLASLQTQLQQVFARKTTDWETRTSVARAVVTLAPQTPFTPLAPLLTDTALPLHVRAQLADALTQDPVEASRVALVEVIRAAPQRSQLKLAQSLVSNADGAETLFQVIGEGKASPRLLLDRTVKEKLLAARPADGAPRLGSLTQGLAPMNEELQRRLDQRRAGYDSAKAGPADGAKLFTQYCAVCHSIDRQGGNVAPQLDGIGTRGLERLCEDVLDPNRNVDRAFRTTLLTLKDGDITSGLYRRDEGELVILADAAGKEFSVPKNNIAQRRESETSLMPENFSEVLSQEDFNHLMAYLLSKGPK